MPQAEAPPQVPTPRTGTRGRCSSNQTRLPLLLRGRMHELHGGRRASARYTCTVSSARTCNPPSRGQLLIVDATVDTLFHRTSPTTRKPQPVTIVHAPAGLWTPLTSYGASGPVDCAFPFPGAFATRFGTMCLIAVPSAEVPAFTFCILTCNQS